MIATGVVRGSPLVRPRMVISPLKPSGTPAARRNLATGPKRGTYQGGADRYGGGASSIGHVTLLVRVRRFYSQ